jgi:hypothetical protein
MYVVCVSVCVVEATNCEEPRDHQAACCFPVKSWPRVRLCMLRMYVVCVCMLCVCLSLRRRIVKTLETIKQPVVFL